MSAKVRAEAAALVDKYCRVFDVPKSLVAIQYTEDDDAIIHCVGAHLGLPTWSLKQASSAGPVAR